MKSDQTRAPYHKTNRQPALQKEDGEDAGR